MTRHVPVVLALWGLLGGLMVISAQGQQTVVNNCPYANHLNSLACLVPDLTKTGNSSNLAAINTTLAQVVGQLPLAVPVSGFVLGFNTKLGIPEDINQNLGSVLTERGSTIGKYKLFLGFTFQRFVFQSVDGTSLKKLPTTFFDANSGVYGTSTASLSANINQYTAIAAFGLTDRIDVSVTLPFQRVSLSAGHTFAIEASANGSVLSPACPGTSSQCPQSLGGSASGVGDLLLNMKGTVINAERSKLAMGSEARFPTGDPYNLLGSGAYGVKPYLVFSRYSGRYTPHLNVGYQWNGFSVLRVNACYFALPGSPNSCLGGTGLPTLRLPDSLDYSGGLDIGIVKRLSVVADLVGQRYFNAPRVTKAVAAAITNLPNFPLPNPTQNPALTQLNNSSTVGIANSSYNVDNVGLGLKWNPTGHLIISANALIRIDDNGLRPARFIPLAGISYKFGK